MLPRLVAFSIAALLTHAAAFCADSAPTFEDLIHAYRGARADPKLVAPAYELTSAYLKLYPADPRALTYKGSLSAQRARDAWMPWSKIGYARDGIALMDQGVDLLLADKLHAGGAQEIEVRMVRAITSAQIPAMFGRYQVAREDLKRVVDSPVFPHMRPQDRSLALAWYAVLCHRAKEADKAGQLLERARAADEQIAQDVWARREP